jgi:hypothetical protein
MKVTTQRTRFFTAVLAAVVLVGLAGCSTSGAQGRPPPGDTPEIVRLYPPEGGQVCLRPQIGVDLVLSDATRKDGSFDISTVTLTLDGNDVTKDAMVPGSLIYPQNQISVLYTPLTPLKAGTHQASFTYASASGKKTHAWTFTVADISCS